MAQVYEYKSITKSHTLGEDYTSCSDVLNAEGQQGWELAAVANVAGVYTSEVYEIFYLKRLL